MLKNNRYIKFIYAFILFISYILICLFTPIFINYNKGIDNKTISQNEDNVDMIKLLITESDAIVELSLNDYLKGVLVGEVPVDYEMEALKAQAVVARTYTLNKLQNATTKHKYGADMCDDINCCQAYKTKEYAFKCWEDDIENNKWQRYVDAVEETSGEVIMYNGELIDALFHAHSGGKTENAKYLWSKTEIPYLISVDGNEDYQYMDDKTFTKKEIKDALSSIIDTASDLNIQIQDYTGSGRANNLKINEQFVEATTLRKLLGIRSTNFRIEESGDNITFYTVGYGHGVGMSQEGANAMAHEGSSYQDIIKHYYTGVELSKYSIK